MHSSGPVRRHRVLRVHARRQRLEVAEVGRRLGDPALAERAALRREPLDLVGAPPAQAAGRRRRRRRAVFRREILRRRSLLGVDRAVERVDRRRSAAADDHPVERRAEARVVLREQRVQERGARARQPDHKERRARRGGAQLLGALGVAAPFARARTARRPVLDEAEALVEEARDPVRREDAADEREVGLAVERLDQDVEALAKVAVFRRRVAPRAARPVRVLLVDEALARLVDECVGVERRHKRASAEEARDATVGRVHHADQQRSIRLQRLGNVAVRSGQPELQPNLGIEGEQQRDAGAGQRDAYERGDAAAGARARGASARLARCSRATAASPRRVSTWP